MNAIVKLINMAERLNDTGSIGDGMVAEFHSVAKEAANAVMRQSDREVAIGEHAFKAGYKAAAERAIASGRRDINNWGFAREQAWSEYAPPEFD